ncbi:hypothetical protein [Tritonibacter mobilis]|uniref:hypothetical protein n=1 Tax=Tritonibacter mobilis TaxID=379347 RepID=UPI001C09B8ED|nr:hypothetical protein [Tritonibacter mobilis]MBU3035471.1 hypothetical protein [Tritonibacter mobilis]WHQ83931.1 hypothetical protein OMR53_07495 [Tritonibacter mobilis]
MNPPFEVQKISNHGVNNPIVARLAIQSNDLLQWLNVKEAKRQEILAHYMELMRRLLACFDIENRLVNARTETVEYSQKVWREGGHTTPHVISLEDEVENFLFASKVYLREIARLINLLFEAGLENDSKIFWNPKGQKSQLVRWAEKTFGPKHSTTKMFASEADWISEVARKRNAVEHPGGWSGTLRVKNFERLPDGRIRPPVWALDDDQEVQETDIYKDISVLMDNMLTVAEDVLVDAIIANPSFPQVMIGMIPEQERDESCPVRLKPTINLGR